MAERGPQRGDRESGLEADVSRRVRLREVAHDLNHLLEAILGRAQLLREEAGRGRATEAMPAALDVIESAARDAAALTAGLLERPAAAIEAVAAPGGPGAAEAAGTDVAGLVAAGLELTRHRWAGGGAGGGGWQITSDVPPGLTAAVPPATAREILLNLLHNALDAMPEGGRLLLTAVPGPDGVELLVEDSGAGLPPGDPERLFGPGVTAGKAGGLGLGLAASRRLARGCGGDLMLEAREGGGARCRWRLPRAAGPAAGRPGRLLVVEDEERVRELLRELLAAAGHRVETADCRRAALAVLGRGVYDALLADRRLPDGDGLEVCRAARAADPALGLVLISGWGEPPSARQLAEAGVDLQGSKPLDLDQLRYLAGAAVALARRRRGRRAAAGGADDPGT